MEIYSILFQIRKVVFCVANNARDVLHQMYLQLAPLYLGEAIPTTSQKRKDDGNTDEPLSEKKRQQRQYSPSSISPIYRVYDKIYSITEFIYFRIANTRSST